MLTKEEIVRLIEGIRNKANRALDLSDNEDFMYSLVKDIGDDTYEILFHYTIYGTKR